VFPFARENGPLMEVAIDDAGNAIVVWPQRAGGITRVRAAMRPPGGAFGPAVFLSPEGQDVREGPRVAMSGSGRAIVAWTTNESPPRLQYRSRRRGTGFSPAATLTPDGAASLPRVAINDAGAGIVAWRDDAGLLHGRVRPAGSAAFAPARQLSPPEFGVAYDPEVAIDRRGWAAAVWDPPESTVGQARRLTPAGSTTGPVQWLGGHWVEVAADPAGGLVAAFRECLPGEGSDGRCSTTVVRSLNGGLFRGAWQAPPEGFRFADLAVASAGAAVIAQLAEPSTVVRRIRGIRLTRDDLLTADRPISSSTNWANMTNQRPQPAVAADGDGNAVVAWDWTRPDRHEVVQFAVYDGGAPRFSDVVVPVRARRRKPVALRATARDRLSGTNLSSGFGDGKTAAGASVRHTYSRCGRYEVGVTARDAAANATTATRRVLVVSPRCRIRARIAARWRVRRAHTTIRRLLVRRLAPGARVRAKCRGRRCPFTRTTAERRPNGTADVLEALGATRVLRTRQTLELRITKPGYIGKVVRYRIRTGEPPRRRTSALRP
jgi:hypothetical protein